MYMHCLIISYKYLDSIKRLYFFKTQGQSPSPCWHPWQGLNLRDHCTNVIRFPPDSFMYCLIHFLNSRYFSSFPHNTCLLSVSCPRDGESPVHGDIIRGKICAQRVWLFGVAAQNECLKLNTDLPTQVKCVVWTAYSAAILLQSTVR